MTDQAPTRSPLIPDELPVELVPITRLRAHPANPRSHHPSALADSLDEFGWYGVVIAQRETGTLIAGHDRVNQLLARGETQVPVWWVDTDDTGAVRRLLADNRTTELSGYDEQALADVLASLNGNLAGTGYTTDDLNDLLAQLNYRPNPTTDGDQPRLDQTAPRPVITCPHCGHTFTT